MTSPLCCVPPPSPTPTRSTPRSYGDYVLDHLESMPKDKKELRAAMRLVVYMDHLLRLFETPFVLRTQRGDSSFGKQTGRGACKRGHGSPLWVVTVTGESEESVPHLAGIPQIIQDRLLSTFCERQVNNRGRTRCAALPSQSTGLHTVTRPRASSCTVTFGQPSCVTSCSCTSALWR